MTAVVCSIDELNFNGCSFCQCQEVKPGTPLVIKWTDDDGDDIDVETQDDFDMAFSELKNGGTRSFTVTTTA